MPPATLLPKPTLLLALALACAAAGPAVGNPAANEAPPIDTNDPNTQSPPDLETALKRLNLPGVTINTAEWSVDLAARICLREGLLELIACTADTKEHEAILAVEARPSHIHTALLLLGAIPGSPAMLKVIESDDPEQGPRFINIPPRGHPVGVFLAFDHDGPKELPISRFITAAGGQDGQDDEDDEDAAFPDGPFLFVGSVLQDAGDGPRRYLADASGHVISIATFGDEILALPGIHGHANDGLMWNIKTAMLPDPDVKVTLRLRPQRPATDG